MIRRSVLGVAVPGSALVALLPAMGWWMANVGFYVLGRLDSREWGYRAWLDGFSGFPRWFQTAFALASVPCWLVALLVIGAAAATSGRRVVVPVLVGLAALTALAVAVVVAGTAVYPDAGS